MIVAARRRPWARRRRCGGDEGSVVTITLVAPVLLVILLIVIQLALTFHARQVAASAASDGLRAAEANGATLADGQAAATRFAAADTTLTVRAVSVVPAGDRIRVEVHGHAPSVFPLLSAGDVTGVAEGPAERFRRPGQR